MSAALQSDDIPAHPTGKTVSPSRDDRIDPLVHEFAQMFERKRSQEGKSLWSLTLTYTESKSSPIKLATANWHLERFHRRLLAYLAGNHRYHRPWFRQIEPELHAFVDVPGSKRKHYRKSSAPIRDSTYHHHCILVVSEQHVEKLRQLQAEKKHSFWIKVARHCRVRTFALRPIGATHEDIVRWTDYASQHARKSFRAPQWEDGYVPLPKSERNNCR